MSKQVDGGSIRLKVLDFGTKTSFARTSQLSVPRMPMTCQLSRNSTSDAGIIAMIASGWPVGPIRGWPFSITTELPETKSGDGPPVANGHCPEIRYPPSTGTATPLGAITPRVRLWPSSLNSSSTVSSG